MEEVQHLFTMIFRISGIDEIIRVLKPGGKFFYMEHIAAEQSSMLRMVQVNTTKTYTLKTPR